MPIRKVRRFMRENPRMALGLQVAMTVLAHNKGAAAGMAAPAKTSAMLASIPSTSVAKAMRDKAYQAIEGSRDVETVASAVWDMAVDTSKNTVNHPVGEAAAKPMSYEQARLWLQAYNAGPYALLRNKGDVPYKETQNYVPRVMKYYAQDLSDTPYDEHIRKSAAKYGLDPQMIRAVMKTESSFNNKTVSHAGARGLMQVMPVVWKDVSKRYGIDWDYMTGVFEPHKNIEVACAYLAWLRYDMLPRHFDAFEMSATVPKALIRDNAPPRSSPRIVTEVARAADAETATALTATPKIESKAREVAQAARKSSGIKIEESRRTRKGSRKPARARDKDNEQGG